ncbi:MAG: choice-of-anchor A family protein [Clostridia bacterium]|nr:choice-of-anchor A family protein [Clostridia bacterium]
MKRNSVYFTIAVILIVSAMVLAYIYPFAKSEPVSGGSATATASSSQTFNVDNSNKNITVNSAEELRKISLLGGTNSELALEENPGLGIAKEFSIFAEEDVTFTGADTEGKVAAGGGVYGQATKRVNGENIPYEYQIGINSSDKYSADVVVGNGPVEGIALNYGYTDDGVTQIEDNKLIAYSSNATNINLDNYTDEEKEHFVEADLFDFESEFERLKQYSQELVNTTETGEVINSSNYVMVGNLLTNLLKSQGAFYSSTDKDQFDRTGIIHHYNRIFYILRGTNPDCNIFSISGDISGNIILDVPYNSKVIINQLSENASVNYSYGQGIYYPLSENQLAEINMKNQRVAYVVENKSGRDAANYIRDENNNIKAFIRVGAGVANGDKSEIEDLQDNILINFPNATKLSIGDVGASILAPKAKVEVEGSKGYLFGTLVCKSYIGDVQIYGKKDNVTRKYKVDVSKIDTDLNERIANAVLELYDSNNQLVHTWSSSLNSEKIELNVGTYKIKEKKAPDNYISNSDELTFIIDSDGCIYNEDNQKISSAEIVFTESYKEKKYVDHEQNWISNNMKFPYTWKALYDGLDENVGNISKLSFEVDTSNAVKRTEDELFLIVAENAGTLSRAGFAEGNNWIEFFQWKSVKDKEKITTNIPIVEELYPYYNENDNSNIVQLRPHFYRQTEGDNSTTEEVFDINVKNVVAYWKEVQYETKTKEIVVSVENEDPITIPNKHITTTVKITKIDANSKKKLAGAVFGIYNSENNELLYTSTKTDKNGEIVLSDLALDKGTYYVKELEAPEGYELSTESKEFVVDGTNSQEFTFEDVIKSKEDQDKSEEEPKEEEQKEEAKEEEPKQEQPKKQEPQQVQTGDTLFIALIVLGLAVIVCGATFVLKKYYK